MAMTSKPIYTCRGKGGEYEIVLDGATHGTIKGAGTLKGKEIVLYRDIHTHQIYVREKGDFNKRMELK